jgi:hypothetical protein
VNAVPTDQKGKVPPPVISAPPEQGIEERVKKNPRDENAKVDLGSDESMDASDPPAVSRAGCGDEPVPSSGFPDEGRKKGA